jgi:hypothetical protein
MPWDLRRHASTRLLACLQSILSVPPEQGTAGLYDTTRNAAAGSASKASDVADQGVADELDEVGLPVGLADDAVDATGRVDVREARHGALDEAFGLGGEQVGDLAVDDADEPVGPGGAEAMKGICADEEEANAAEAVAGGAEEVEEGG